MPYLVHLTRLIHFTCFAIGHISVTNNEMDEMDQVDEEYIRIAIDQSTLTSELDQMDQADQEDQILHRPNTGVGAHTLAYTPDWFRKGGGNGISLSCSNDGTQKRDDFTRGGFHFTAIWDHILESQCTHANSTTNGDSDCSRCLFERSLRLPELPEMVFPKNTLVVDFTQFPGSSISFSALEALKMVSSDTLPDVQVAPSSVWQEARQGMTGRMAHPFDWTFTSKYAGSVQNCTVEVTNDPIDLERLKRQEPIGFYAQVTLYEDELADHGTAQMSVRIRVMPDFFFVLMRFYLRIDRVLVRVCDTRLVGDNGKNHVIREWSLREAKVADLQHLPPEVLLDGNQVWALLPVVESKNEKITPISS